MTITILLEWFNPMTWKTAQVSNIIAFFSAAGTIGALLYAYYLERKNSKKINDLGNIVTELRDQNEMFRLQFKDEAAPKLIIVKAAIIYGDYITVTLLNKGKKAKIGRIKYIGDDFNFSNSGNIVLPNEELNFFCTLKTKKKIEKSTYSILFEYFDIYGNSYALHFTGEGDEITTTKYYEVSPSNKF